MRDFSERDLTYFRKAHIGFVFQNFNLISHQSVLENVKMPLYVKNMTDKEMAEIAERELSRLGIGDFIKKNVKQLSGGQKQRVAIARALVNNPEMIVADEPTGNLDRKNAQNILDMMMDLKTELNTSLIVVTHDDELATRFERVMTMQHGHLQNKA